MRAAWLESHDEFEGVGAHELNVRYDHVDDPDNTFDPPDAGIEPNPVDMPALARARSMAFMYAVPGRLDGADTSHYQTDHGRMDMAAARAAGLTWWAHKVSQSTGYADPTWNAASAAMQSASFVHRLGYHWLSSTTDPVRQAFWLLSVMGEAIHVMGVMGDCEEQPLTPDQCIAFYETIENITHKPCAHYTGAYVGGGRIFADAGIRMSAYGPRPIVLAAYTTRIKMQSLPNVARLGIHAWQFSSNGPVPGIVGRCDMDEIQDAPAFALVCGALARPPIEVEPTPAPAPAGPPSDLIKRGGPLYSLVANSDAAAGSDDEKVRWAWNGLVKVLLTFPKYNDFLHGGLLIAGHDDLTKPLMMDTATLDSYPTI